VNGLGYLWFIRRHVDLLEEAQRERLARDLRQARKAPAWRPAPPDAVARAVVRRGNDRDAPRIAQILELNGMPRWVAFEERFILAEEDGTLLAAVRFREGTARLHLGLLVTDPWADEGSLATALYAGAREVARGLGLGEVEALTLLHQRHVRGAGYHRRGGIWRSLS